MVKPDERKKEGPNREQYVKLKTMNLALKEEAISQMRT
jgi:hypothetical protein